LGLFGAPDWPQQRLAPVVVTATIIGVAYAIYSEFVNLNTVVREAWVYSSLMPVVPGLRIGLAPLVQWLIVPPLALIWAMHAVHAAKFQRKCRGSLAVGGAVPKLRGAATCG
jgi:hypothetical protein